MNEMRGQSWKRKGRQALAVLALTLGACGPAQPLDEGEAQWPAEVTGHEVTGHEVTPTGPFFNDAPLEPPSRPGGVRALATCDPNALSLTWPLRNSGGTSWVVNNWVDDNQTAGTIQDFMGNTGGLAATYDNHGGIDIDTASFAETDNDSALVYSASPGVVESVVDSRYDRNDACLDGGWNAVTVRHANGFLLMYGHIKRGSARVKVGDTVQTGTLLATVASSGCSTNQHLHFEVRDCNNRIVDTMRRTSNTWVQGVPDDPWTNAPAYYGPPGVLAIRLAQDSYPDWWRINEPRYDVGVFKPGSPFYVGIGLSALGSNINGPGVTAPPRGADTLSFVIKRPDGTVFAGPVTWSPGSGSRYSHKYTSWGSWTLPDLPGRWRVEASVNGVLYRVRYFTVADAEQHTSRLGDQVLISRLPEASVQNVLGEMSTLGRRPVRLDAYDVNGSVYFNLLFKSADGVKWSAKTGLDGSQYQSEFDLQVGTYQRRPVSLDSYVSGGVLRYASLFTDEPGPAWFAEHQRTDAQQAATQSGLATGWRPVIVSGATVNGTRYYASVYQYEPGVAWAADNHLTQSEYQTMFNAQMALGRAPVYLDGYVDGGVARLSAIFAPIPTALVARHNLTAPWLRLDMRQYDDDGFAATVLTGYSNGGTPTFAAVWQRPSLSFSASGAVPDRMCLSVNEPGDAVWSNNYLCGDSSVDYPLRWFTSGVSGLDLTQQTCTLIREPSDPDGWDNNYLCRTNRSNLRLSWTSVGAPPGNGEQCVRWYEGSDVAEGWDDNYLCYGTVPSNDPCANAIELPVQPGTLSLTGSTERASQDGLPSCSAASDVFYKFTLTSSRTVTLDTFGSGYDTYVGITQSCGQAPLACNDDSDGTRQSKLTQTLAPGTYYVTVGGYSTFTGDYTLNFTR
ncbi:MAG TPA: peptidoglycan DD-metalloendopeptidase family protein [Archangium sp.]|uniref:peptidoglycan DD-metalloendopeptidase family protein n=1 Tax=Archangium sp. TaxID=1872627 RepID=UPI002E304501|nr:peptidoglycan DD-metalloendopeptidase family protein [Archangium sp.]HEX5752119.1 peptidoglycan DD-metalloendopeptidase family protein [Archangium sp.]